jgi:D-serine deaminase-like pyridoxal phosphate-dependent protein
MSIKDLSNTSGTPLPSFMETLLADPIDWRYKGFFDTPNATIGNLGGFGWSVFGEHVVTPIMMLKETALEHNLELMASYCAERNVLLAPHCKTTMSPQLAQRQIEAGAWGLTTATVSQARVFHHFGFDRILVANEVLARADLKWILRSRIHNPNMVFATLVDSIDAVSIMDDAIRNELAENFPTTQCNRLPVLVEVGYSRGRAGARKGTDVLNVARAVANSSTLRLAGLEGFEGLIPGPSQDDRRAAVSSWFRYTREIVDDLMSQNLLVSGMLGEADSPVISFGGSSYFDLVVDELGGEWAESRGVQILLRSGCYLTHDHGKYAESSPWSDEAGNCRHLLPALEVWGTVLSTPEAGLAIVDFGRRDVPYDSGFPIPLWFGRKGVRRTAREFRIVAINDQHAYVEYAGATLASDLEPKVGDI